jgi:purine-binding chemotaxis protein CheW
MPEERLTLDAALAERAAATADREVDLEPPRVKLVIFTVGADRYAFHGRHVREILSQQPVFFVPGCPPVLEGVVNVRGDIESVLRLDVALGQAATPGDRDGVILLAEGGGLRSGVRVGRVLDVLDVAEELIQPPLATWPERLRTLVVGEFSHQGEGVVLLDLERLFRLSLQGDP